MSEVRIGVVGAGGWGSALALMLGREMRAVTLWARDPVKADALARSRVNETYLPGHELPETIEVTSDLARVARCPYLILAVPSQSLRSVWKLLSPLLTAGHTVINAAKGIEVSTGLLLSQVLLEKRCALAPERLAVLSGPNHAEEVAAGLPTTSVVAAKVPATAAEWQDLLMSPMFRVYTSDDVVGVELAGALKNVIALGAGIADGLGYGDNTKAAIITRGLAEMSRLGVAQGARALTFSGLAGVGDLVATCNSGFSRNTAAGRRIGAGEPVDAVLRATPKVVEGVPTCRAALDLAGRLGVEMPITQAVGGVLFAGKKPKEAVAELMGRGPKSELEALYP